MGEQDGDSVHLLGMADVKKIEVVLEDGLVPLSSELVPPAEVDIRVEVSHVVVPEQEDDVRGTLLLQGDDLPEHPGGIPGGDLLPWVGVEVVSEEDYLPVPGCGLHGPSPERPAVYVGYYGELFTHSFANLSISGVVRQIQSYVAAGAAVIGSVDKAGQRIGSHLACISVHVQLDGFELLVCQVEVANPSEDADGTPSVSVDAPCCRSVRGAEVMEQRRYDHAVLGEVAAVIQCKTACFEGMFRQSASIMVVGMASCPEEVAPVQVFYYVPDSRASCGAQPGEDFSLDLFFLHFV